MSLASQIAALTNRVATEIKALVRPEHPGIARAWVKFGYIGGTIHIGASHNVSAVTRLATGRYRVSFAAPFVDADYCWLAFARSSANTGTVRSALVRSSSDTKTASYVDVACATGNSSFADTTEMNLVVYR